jgi:hypothetical protein
VSRPRVSVLLPVRDEELALGAVSGPEGRARVRELAAGLGLVDGTDFVAVA